MQAAFDIVARALGLWWKQFITFIALNLAWFGLQLLIFTGPPATLAMYVVIQEMMDTDIIEVKTAWNAFRSSFVPAWKWGGINLLLVIVFVTNFLVYGEATGAVWVTLRISWGVIALIWFTVNLFYWPFWLSEEDRSVVNTFRNCFVYLARRPLTALALGVGGAVIGVVGLLTTLPFTTVVMTWLALFGMLAVNDELKGIKREA